MQKGLVEYAVLLVVSESELYVSDILEKLTEANFLTVEGTLYPLLSRLQRDGLLKHRWEESESGPPRKYYSLTEAGIEYVTEQSKSWHEIVESFKLLK